MMLNLFILFLIMLMMTAILLQPTVCVSGAASGLMIWFDSALPSLFPFMVLTGLIIRMNTLETLSMHLKKYRLSRHIPVPFVFTMIIGLMCGYPMGIRTVSELRNSGQLNKKQASLLITFVNQPGPMFILGFALPLCRLDGTLNRQFVLAFYGGLILTALTSSTVSSFGPHSVRTGRADTGDSVIPPPDVHREQTSFFLLFEETVLSSMVTLTKIGGYMMLFSLITALMKASFPEHPDLMLILGGLLEMTSGIANVSVLNETYLPYLILCFLSFGGLCVTAQSFSLGKLNHREQIRYLGWKIIQSILSISLFYLLNTYFST